MWVSFSTLFLRALSFDKYIHLSITTTPSPDIRKGVSTLTLNLLLTFSTYVSLCCASKILSQNTKRTFNYPNKDPSYPTSNNASILFNPTNYFLSQLESSSNIALFLLLIASAITFSFFRWVIYHTVIILN